MKTELDDFQQFVKQQIEFVDTTKVLERLSTMSEQSQDDLFHILCDRSCLNADSDDVRIAWRVLLEKRD